MGTSHELRLNIILKSIEEIGPVVHTLLTRFFNQREEDDIEKDPKDQLPDHPFWKLERFYRIGCGHYDSKDNVVQPKYEHPLLQIDCDINHGGNEIDLFLDWIAPYVDSVPEPGTYKVEGSWEWNLERTEIAFGYLLNRQPSFAMLNYYERGQGSWMGTYTEVIVDWVKPDPHYKLKNT
jgi:hypothetical protein